MSAEIWRAVPGYEGLYEVSNLGRVQSLDRRIELGGNGYGGSYVKPGRILRHLINTHGRHQVTLCRDGRQRLYLVHRVVAQAFIGHCPDGLCVLHWDDDPDHNHLSNLRYGTLSENQYDRYRNARRLESQGA
jgi:hypothetical protein